MPKYIRKPTTSFFFEGVTKPAPRKKAAKLPMTFGKIQAQTAIVYCEGHFGGMDGKTANGWVRHSEKYEILSIIDSAKAGQDAGDILDGKPNGILVCRNLEEAIAAAGSVPGYFIFEIAPASGMPSTVERGLLLKAIKLGMNIVTGLHKFLNEDPEFAVACAESGVTIRDVQKPHKRGQSPLSHLLSS